MPPSSDARIDSAARPRRTNRVRSSRAGVSVAAPRTVVGGRRRAGSPRSCGRGTAPARRSRTARRDRRAGRASRAAPAAARAGARPGHRPFGSEPERESAARTRPARAAASPCPASPSSETTALMPVAERRRRGEPLGAEAAVRAAVRREEDERVLRLRPPGDRAEPAVAARELDQGSRAGGVVVRARARRRCRRGGRGSGSRRRSRPARR